MLKLEGPTLINLLEECLKQNKIDYDFKKLDSIIRLIRPRLDLLTSVLPSSIYFFLSPKNYSLITIPPNVWNGFKGIGKNESYIANCLTLPHNEKEMFRKDPNDKYFNYNW